MTERDYQPILADTPEGRAVHYRMRYKVFCLETGFEPPEYFPDGQERDAYDDRAVHFLVRSRYTGHWVATLRLILRGSHGLQIEQLCRLHPELQRSIARGTVAEASRLSIVGLPSSGAIPGAGLRGGRGLVDRLRARRASPQILVKLLRAAGHYGLLHGIDHLVCLIRPTLARLVTEMGVPLAPCGHPCRHRGVRVPHGVSCRALSAALDRLTSHSGAMDRDDPPYALFSEIAAPETAAWMPAVTPNRVEYPTALWLRAEPDHSH